MEGKIRYGAHEEIHPQAFVVDRTNLFVGRVELHVTNEDRLRPSSGYMSLNFGNQVAGRAGLNGLVKSAGGRLPSPLCVGVERRYDDAASMAIYSYTFEGIALSSQQWIEFELEFTMNQEPIETHPSFANLNEIFGPYDALNRLWPQYITQQSAVAGLAAQQQAGPIFNPLYGVSSYFSPGLMYRMSYTDIDVNADLMHDIGVAFTSPPKIGEAFPQLSGWLAETEGRNWLKMAPKIRQRGSCISVVEEYMLSGPRPWDPNIYTDEALKGQSL